MKYTQILNLPPEPEHAFLQFLESIDEALEKRLSGLSPYTDGDVYDTAQKLYVSKLRGFFASPYCKALPKSVSDKIADAFEFNDFDTFHRQIGGAAIELAATQRYKNTSGEYTISVSENTKQKIHEYLTKIRGIVSSLDISEEKRDAIMVRVNDLGREIDTGRTRKEVVLDLILDTSYTLGEAGKKIKPFVDRITELLGYAKNNKSVELLDAPEEKKLLKGPKNQPEDNEEIKTEDC